MSKDYLKASKAMPPASGTSALLARTRGMLRRLNSPEDTQAAGLVAVVLLCAEAALCGLIIARVPYTPIDWEAYMEQVEGFLQGERDYRNLKGNTGPLVYPAGFLYAFSVLRWLTGGGLVQPAQLLFAGIYLATLAVILWLYVRARVVPPWALGLLCLSKQLHSIYMLRLFNDCVAMLLAYAATALLVEKRWRGAALVYSAAVSVKMNVLLMAPPVLVVMLKAATLQDVARAAVLGLALQAALGAPFLSRHPAAYAGRAFELSRAFLHTWSVNLKFLPERVFLSPALAVGLLAAHLALLWLFAEYRWCSPEGGLAGALRGALQRSKAAAASSAPPPRGPDTSPARTAAAPPARSGSPAGVTLRNVNGAPPRTVNGSPARGAHAAPVPGSGLGVRGARGRAAGTGGPFSLPSAEQMLLIVFTGNLIGVACARSLHYQFYSWYAHSLPALLWATRLHVVVKLGLWLAVELMWNTFPSTPTSSLSLTGCHAGLLLALWLQPRPARAVGKVQQG